MLKKQPEVQNCFVYLGGYPEGCFYDKHVADEMLIQLCKSPGETIYWCIPSPEVIILYWFNITNMAEWNGGVKGKRGARWGEKKEKTGNLSG